MTTRNDNSKIVKIEDINKDGEWVTFDAMVQTLWENGYGSIAQVGLLRDETGITKFVVWTKAHAPVLKEGKIYTFQNVAVSEYNERFSVSINKNSRVIEQGQTELDV